MHSTASSLIVRILLYNYLEATAYSTLSILLHNALKMQCLLTIVRKCLHNCKQMNERASSERTQQTIKQTRSAYTAAQ